MSIIGLCEVVELACRAKSCDPDRPKSLAPDLKTAQHLQAITLKSQVQKLLPFLLFLAFCCRVLRAWP